MKRLMKDIPRGTVCKYCGHVYMAPCHGQQVDCANAVAKRAMEPKKKAGKKRGA